MSSFEQLEVGAKVIVRPNAGRDYVATVERITKILIIVSHGGRFSRRDGWEYGASPYYRSHLSIADEASLELLKKNTRILNMQASIMKLSFVRGLNESELERITAIIKESEARHASKAE